MPKSLENKIIKYMNTYGYKSFDEAIKAIMCDVDEIDLMYEVSNYLGVMN